MNGGERIDVGVDTNNDGSLDPGEVQQTTYICNGTGACGLGLSICGNTCANLTFDSNNCGACGNVCSAGQICTMGACVSSMCPVGETIDFTSDNLNCGACGNVCQGGTTCGGAQCVTVNFGNVPVGTNLTKNVTITIDAGYRMASATTTGPNAFNFGTCSVGGTGIVGPASCTATETFASLTPGPTHLLTTVQECPVGGGPCISIPITMFGNGV